MIEQFYDLKPQVLELDRKTLELCRDQFAHLEEIRDYNQLKMLRAFTDCGVEARHFLGSTGYGVWDDSRNKLEEVFSRCMGAEDALVRPQFMSGTHTLTVALFGLLRAGDTLLAATGRPYDTLEGVIGIGEAGKGCGTLQEYGIHYDEVPLLPDFTPDYAAIAEHAKTATVVHIQRSRGYTQRNAFDLDTIQKVADTARKANPDVVIFVDNCYGEFTQIREPLSAGADVIAGSFIKNPGGGITPTGGYIAGRRDLVEGAAMRLSNPRYRKGVRLHLWGQPQPLSRAFPCPPYHGPGSQDGGVCRPDDGAAGLPDGAHLRYGTPRHHSDDSFWRAGAPQKILQRHPVRRSGGLLRDTGALGHAGVMTAR